MFLESRAIDHTFIRIYSILYTVGTSWVHASRLVLQYHPKIRFEASRNYDTNPLVKRWTSVKSCG